MQGPRFNPEKKKVSLKGEKFYFTVKLVSFDLYLIESLDPHRFCVLFSLRQGLVSLGGL